MAAVANMNGGTSFTEEYVALSIQEYLKEVNENPELETKLLEVGDGLAISKKK